MIAKEPSKLATKYGKALFDVSKTADLTSTQEGFSWIIDKFRKHDELRSALFCPVYSREEKKRVVEAVFLNEKNVNEHLTRLIVLLIENDRISLIEDVFQAFEIQIKASKGIILVGISTAYELTATEKKDITKKLTADLGKEIEVEWDVDKSLIGGIRIVLQGEDKGEQVYDGSIKSRLQRLRRELLH